MTDFRKIALTKAKITETNISRDSLPQLRSQEKLLTFLFAFAALSRTTVTALSAEIAQN